MRQAPRLARLIKEFQGNGLAFQALFPNALESREKVQSFLKARELALEFRLDPGGRLAKRHNVEVVPTAILLDHSGKQVYFGAIDDAKASHQVRVHYLRNAIEDLLAKRKVRVSFGKPFGCYLMP